MPYERPPRVPVRMHQWTRESPPPKNLQFSGLHTYAFTKLFEERRCPSARIHAPFGWQTQPCCW